jgi:ELWxxDGT repeat protein
VNGKVFFTIEVTSEGYQRFQLWSSDGTTAGTGRVGGYTFQNAYAPFDPVAVNGAVYFAADDGVHGDELWRSDGTAAGTKLVKDLNGNGSGYPVGLTNVNGTLYFWGYKPSTGYALYRTSGTDAGTVLIKDIDPSLNPPGWFFPVPSFETPTIQVFNGKAYFAITDGVHGTELWRTDGTAAGTVLAADVWPGVSGSRPLNLTVLNGALLFSASDGVHGWEMWKYV